MIGPVGEKEGFKITYLPIMIKAASAALNEYPTLNSYVSKDEPSTNFLFLFFRISIGYSNSFLKVEVPNVKNCEQSVYNVKDKVLLSYC